MALKDRSNPMQPIGYDTDGVIRFKANRIVLHLLDSARAGKKCDLNDLAIMQELFSIDDWSQFYQLIGYSVSGFGEVQRADDNAVAAAEAIAEELHQRKERKKRRRRGI